MAYAHLRLPAAMGHMLWPHYDTGSQSINGVIDRRTNNNESLKNTWKKKRIVGKAQKMCYDVTTRNLNQQEGYL